jgi:hypothetical protein
MQLTEEEAMKWYNEVDEKHKFWKFKQMSEQWYVKLGLMILALFLVPYLKGLYNRSVIDPTEIFPDDPQS